MIRRANDNACLMEIFSLQLITYNLQVLIFRQGQKSTYGSKRLEEKTADEVMFWSLTLWQVAGKQASKQANKQQTERQEVDEKKRQRVK